MHFFDHFDDKVWSSGKGNIPSSFQSPVTDLLGSLLGLICSFNHDKKKFTSGAWQLRIERTKSVFKYIWWIMNVHRGMCVASFDPFSAHMRTWFTAEMRKLKEFSFKASCSLYPHSPRLSPSLHPEAKVDKSHVCSLLSVGFNDIAALWFLGFRHIARLEQEFLLM